jgi:hypothetical protein
VIVFLSSAAETPARSRSRKPLAEEAGSARPVRISPGKRRQRRRRDRRAAARRDRRLADGASTEALIRSEFGDRIADIVAGCSGAVAVPGQPKPPWRERKETYIAYLAVQDDPDVLSGQPKHMVRLGIDVHPLHIGTLSDSRPLKGAEAVTPAPTKQA